MVKKKLREIFKIVFNIQQQTLPIDLKDFKEKVDQLVDENENLENQLVNGKIFVF
jgi:regulator of replication initiation timing